MKTFLFLAPILMRLLASAQGVTQLPDRILYRGNPYSFSLVLTAADSMLTSSGVLSYEKNGRALESISQPVVSQSGRMLTLSWSAAQTRALPQSASWLEIRTGVLPTGQAGLPTGQAGLPTGQAGLPTGQAGLPTGQGGITRFTAWVITSKTPQLVTSPGPSSPGTAYIPLPTGQASGSTSQVYPLANAPPSGQIITHNKATRLVRSTFFRDDTGQPDPLWHTAILTDASVEIVGPPGETFSGRIALEFISSTTN